MTICPKHNEPMREGTKACETCYREIFGRPAKWSGDQPKPKRTRKPPANMAGKVAEHRAEEVRLKWDYKGGSE